MFLGGFLIIAAVFWLAIRYRAGKSFIAVLSAITFLSLVREIVDNQPVKPILIELTGLSSAQYQRVIYQPLANLVVMLFIITIVMLVVSATQSRAINRVKESRYRSVVENAPICIHEIDQDGRLTAINPAGLQMINAKYADDVLEKPYLDFVEERDRNRIASLMQQAFAGTPVEFEFRVSIDGTAHVFSSNFVPLKDSDGMIGRLMGITQDITERTNAERHLKEYAQELSDIYHDTPCGFHSIDASGMFLQMNETELAWLGYRREELIGKLTIRDVLTPESYRTLVANLKQDDYACGFRGHEYEMKRRDGSTFPIMASSSFVHDELGRFVKSRCSVLDITERKQSEKVLRELDAQMQLTQKLESLRVLAGGAAHDFNNLLVTVLGHAGLAKSETTHSEAIHEHLEQIETAAQRAAELCDQMLAYAGKRRIETATVDVNQVVREMAQLLESTIARRATFQIHLAEAILEVDADVTQIRQVIMNLIINAAEAIGPSGGNIRLSSGTIEAEAGNHAWTYGDEQLSKGEYVYVEVSDDGCGMDHSTICKVFDPFFSTKFAGRGLGMAAVLGIVRGHKGAIQIDSTVGAGTTVRVLVPVSTADDRPLPKSSKPVTFAEPIAGTILLVDDEQIVRDTTRRILEAAGFDVVTANDGHEAVTIARVQRDSISAILLDMTMPGLNGEETYHELRRQRVDAPVLLTSGYDQQQASPHAADRIAAGFIKKPYRPHVLVEKIREVLQPQLSAGHLLEE